MKIQAPVRHIKRASLTCYRRKDSYNTSMALSGQCVLDIPDDVEAILYTARDNGNQPVGQFLWELGSWVSLVHEDAQCRVEELDKRSMLKTKPKPKARKPKRPSLEALSKTYRASHGDEVPEVHEIAKKLAKVAAKDRPNEVEDPPEDK